MTMPSGFGTAPAVPGAAPGLPSPVPPSSPMPPAGGTLPATPPMLGAMPPAAPAPPPPQQPPATISSDGKLQERLPPEKITNPFERQAAMIVQTAEDWAGRLAQNLGDHPADYTSAPTDTVHEMFHFSPYGVDAPRQFWAQHEQLLQMATQANDPNPYAVAERGALDAVYPYRSKMALLDSLGPEQRVQRAEQLKSISDRQSAAGNPPETMALVTGPAGLPPDHPLSAHYTPPASESEAQY